MRHAALAAALFAVVSLWACEPKDVDPPVVLPDAGEPDASSADAGQPDADSPSPDGGPDLLVPDLAPVTAARAASVAGYARKLSTRAIDGEDRPTAWSMVSDYLPERTMALQYALAVAADPLPAQPPPMAEADLTDTRIDQLRESPKVQLAGIELTGPLVVEQKFLLKDGSEVVADPLFRWWPSINAAVVNVDGRLRVIDLALGDQPLDPAYWAKTYVADPVTCGHLSEADFQVALAYWIAVKADYDTPARPAKPCGWRYAPAFGSRWNEKPAYNTVRGTPLRMSWNLDGLGSLLADFGLDVPEADRPYVLSRFAAKPETRLCAENPDLKFCQ